jgi:hypothetical protein
MRLFGKKEEIPVKKPGLWEDRVYSFLGPVGDYICFYEDDSRSGLRYHFRSDADSVISWCGYL